MLTGLEGLKNTDWSRLHHAYGRATDTPEHLRALLGEDPNLRKAMSHLWSAVIHQGTPWTATGPTALVVAGFLSDERIDRGEPVRASLLSFLVSVAEAPKQAGFSVEDLERMAAFDIEPFIDAGDDDALYGGNEDAANSFYAHAILDCIRVRPVLMKVMLDGLEHGSPRVRACAAMGAATLVKSESLQSYKKDLESRLLAMARGSQNSDERSSHVLALADIGFSPVGFLDDPSPAVRMCAALAPSLASNPVASAELIKALENAASIDDWFAERPPQFPMRPRFTVVARLVERVKDFERLVSAAESVLRVTWSGGVDFDWGPLLVAAFPDASGIVRTEAQRRFLRALVQKADLWHRTLGNAYKWFNQAGLPYDRGLCAERIGT